MRRWFALVPAVLGLALAAPAEARNWVSIPGGYWVDRDSIRRDGALAYFYGAWTGPDRLPGEVSTGTTYAYNCRTRFLYGVQDGRLVAPGRSRTASEVSRADAGVYAGLLCH